MLKKEYIFGVKANLLITSRLWDASIIEDPADTTNKNSSIKFLCQTFFFSKCNVCSGGIWYGTVLAPV